MRKKYSKIKVMLLVLFTLLLVIVVYTIVTDHLKQQEEYAARQKINASVAAVEAELRKQNIEFKHIDMCETPDRGWLKGPEECRIGATTSTQKFVDEDDASSIHTAYKKSIDITNNFVVIEESQLPGLKSRGDIGISTKLQHIETNRECVFNYSFDMQEGSNRGNVFADFSCQLEKLAY